MTIGMLGIQKLECSTILHYFKDAGNEHNVLGTINAIPELDILIDADVAEEILKYSAHALEYT